MVGTTIKSAWSIASITMRAYCLCGDAIHTTVNDPGTLAFVMETFAEVHQGEGHGPTDSKTAARARKKRERHAVS